MGILKSYGFGIYLGANGLSEDVLSLFSCLTEHPDKRIEYAGEIVANGLMGAIDFGRNFNIDAYQYTIKNNNKLSQYARAKNELFIDSCSSGDETYTDVIRGGGIVLEKSSDPALNKMEDAYEQIENDEELRWAIKCVKSIQKDMFIVEQVDFIGLLKQALNKIPNALEKVKEICEGYPVVAEQVKIILSSKVSIEECFPEFE